MLGAKLSISSSAPFRTVKQCPLRLKYGSPPPRGLCAFNLALSSSVMGGHVEGSGLFSFYAGQVGLDRFPHFVTCLSTEHRIKGLRKNQESLTLKPGNLIFRQWSNLLQNWGRHYAFSSLTVLGNMRTFQIQELAGPLILPTFRIPFLMASPCRFIPEKPSVVGNSSTDRAPISPLSESAVNQTASSKNSTCFYFKTHQGLISRNNRIS